MSIACPFYVLKWETQIGPRFAMKSALDVKIGPRSGTDPRYEFYIYI